MAITIDKITEINQVHEFNAIALELFHFQAKNCMVYAKYLELIGVNASSVKEIEQIPFLPIELFKSQKVVTGIQNPQKIFKSSGTSGADFSQHFITDLDIYNKSLVTGFGLQFGAPQKYCILGLLPGYLERNDSSLVYMVNHLQEIGNHAQNGNYLNEFEKLNQALKSLAQQNQKAILFGVSFALLDFGEKFPGNYPNLTIIETGGMKGQRKELTRDELHKQLNTFFPNAQISSEYGMTELLSQAWFYENVFHCPPWMKILIREKNDPLTTKLSGSGGLNIIDLANINSCCFIATGDAGQVFENGTFNVLGRLDNQDIRGCNLMYEEE